MHLSSLSAYTDEGLREIWGYLVPFVDAAHPQKVPGTPKSPSPPSPRLFDWLQSDDNET